MRLSRAVEFFRLTKRDYFLDFFITPPITLAFAAYSISRDAGWWWLPQFVAGWIAWTAYEYALHRWALHGLPFFRDVHAMHHRNQLDYIAVPPWATVATYAAFWLAFGMRSSAAAVGFSAGYIAYAALHTAFHYARFLPGTWLHAQDQRHAAHHRFGDRCYGISTSAWDRLLGTER